MMMKSMRYKLWAGMMSLILIVIVLLWFFQIVFLKSFYTNIRIGDVKKEAYSIAKLINGSDNREFKNKLDVFSFNSNLNVELLDTNGNSIYVTGSSGMGGQMPMMNYRSRGDVYNSALSGKESDVTLTHPRFGNKFILTGLPVKASGKVTGVLIINIPLAPVEDTASILKQQLFYITIILLAASILISFFISRDFTRPILEIKKVSEKMALGDFSARIKTNKQDEIGLLANTINHLGQQLSKIENLRKDLIANISHELRTPLSLIRGYAETMRDVTGNVPEKRDKQLGIIIEETERLSSIVDDILNLSQLQSGYSKLNKSSFSITELLDAVITKYSDLSEKSKIAIILQKSNDVAVEADKSRLEQVLYNLMNNAFNHTPEGGSITLRLVDKDDVVRIEIKDTGTGIAREDLPHIWDRYYKSDSSKDRKTKGTGLGLAIVKSVLEAHEALFGVESIEGAGTTFWFEIKKHLINN
ncbi:MAG TPA: ATP-binding protein [Clostridia bacterium]|nr:ATP-binding protein [Clostridia bacterium]